MCLNKERVVLKSSFGLIIGQYIPLKSNLGLNLGPSAVKMTLAQKK